MSLQNPVFIPGPTNIPDAIRKVCDMPTLDHRSAAFARLFRPAVDGVRRILKMAEGEVIRRRGHPSAFDRHRRLGGGDQQYPVAR